MRRRFFLVENPGAGVAGSPLVEDAVRLLTKAGASVARCPNADIPSARTAVRKAAASGSYDAIVAAGGDGTIRHAAASLIGANMPLGIIPVGTGNVLAHEIGLARTPPAITRMLLEGPVATVACAEANGEPFLLMVGAGFDARVVGALDQRLKSRVGKAAYAGPLLGAIVRPVDTLSGSSAGRVAAARTRGASRSTIPRLVLAAVTRAVALTPSAISSPTPRRCARRRANAGPSASAERTMSAYVVSGKSWAGVMLPGLAADTSSRQANWTSCASKSRLSLE